MEAPPLSPVSDKVKLKEIFFLVVSSPGRDLKGTALDAVPSLTTQALISQCWLSVGQKSRPVLPFLLLVMVTSAYHSHSHVILEDS